MFFERNFAPILLGRAADTHGKINKNNFGISIAMISWLCYTHRFGGDILDEDEDEDED